MPEPHKGGRWVTVHGRAVYIVKTPKGTVVARPSAPKSQAEAEARGLVPDRRQVPGAKSEAEAEAWRKAHPRKKR